MWTGFFLGVLFTVLVVGALFVIFMPWGLRKAAEGISTIDHLKGVDFNGRDGKGYQPKEGWVGRKNKTWVPTIAISNPSPPEVTTKP